MLIKINAENTRDGNPQRGWIHTDSHGRFLQFLDESYDNGGAELRRLRKHVEPETLSINVTVKEYKRVKGLSNGIL